MYISIIQYIRILLVCTGIFVLAGWLPAHITSAEYPGNPQLQPEICADFEQACPRGVLLQMAEGSTIQTIQSYFAAQELQVLGYLPQIGVWQVESQAAVESAELAARLEADPAVSWVEVDGLMRIAVLEPSDTFYLSQQDNLRLIRMPDAWDITTGGALPIAVVDTGIDLDHPDLREKIWSNAGEIPSNGIDDDGNGYIDDVQGWDFLHADALPQDDHGHGSHVSGIAAADTDNAVGIAGISWGADLMALKAMDNQGFGTWSDISQAILYAADNGAKVINLSIGGEDASQTVENAIDYARNQGCLVAAAVGNSGGAVLFPARLPDVLAVAATDDNDLPWSFSNRGPEVDLSAPGVGIFSANALNSYTVLSGTSMSTAHVSGLASLVWSMNSSLSPDQVVGILNGTAEDVWSPGFDTLTGWGRIDAFAAVNSFNPEYIFFPSVYRSVREVLFTVYIPYLQTNAPTR